MKRSLTLATAGLCAALLTAGIVVTAQPDRPVRDRDRIHQTDADAPWRGDRGPGNFAGRFGPGGPGQGPGIQALGQRFGQGPAAQGLRATFPFWKHDAVVEELGLTDSQVASLDESWNRMKEALEDTEGSVLEAAKALREEMQKDSPDLTTVLTLHDQVHNERASKARIALVHAVAVKNVLTAEQEEALPKALRGAVRDNMPAIMELRREIRDLLQDGGTPGDVEALISGADLDAPFGEIGLNMFERRQRLMEKGVLPLGDPDAPPPPRGPRAQRQR